MQKNRLCPRRSCAALLFLMFSTFLCADTSFNTPKHAAWSGNTGWILFRHDRPSSPEGVVFGACFLSGLAYSANTGWINLGDGTPDNGYAYSNTGTDHGVNHDGVGNLSGYAWSANTGWIHFGWAASGDANRPKVDLLTGDVSGYAWSGNLGWIQLGTAMLSVASMDDVDSDTDGIADHWEMKHFGNLTTATASSDTDQDGFQDTHEYEADTDPQDDSSFLMVMSLASLSDTQTHIEFLSTPSRLYRILVTDELSATTMWNDSGLGTIPSHASGMTGRTVNHASLSTSPLFFTVEAFRPLSL